MSAQIVTTRTQAKFAQAEKDAIVYSKIAGCTDARFEADAQQLIKDLEDSYKTDLILKDTYSYMFYDEGLRTKLHDLKIGKNELTLLHMAAKNCRKNYYLFLVKELKFGKFLLFFIFQYKKMKKTNLLIFVIFFYIKDTNFASFKNKFTPLHMLVKSNSITKQEYENLDSLNEVTRDRILSVY
jgi:hypothetical protein